MSHIVRFSAQENDSVASSPEAAGATGKQIIDT